MEDLVFYGPRGNSKNTSSIIPDLTGSRRLQNLNENATEGKVSYVKFNEELNNLKSNADELGNYRKKLAQILKNFTDVGTDENKIKKENKIKEEIKAAEDALKKYEEEIETLSDFERELASNSERYKNLEAAVKKAQNTLTEFNESSKEVQKVIELYGKDALETIKEIDGAVTKEIENFEKIKKEAEKTKEQLILKRSKLRAERVKATLSDRIFMNLADTADAYDIELDSKYQGVGEKIGKGLLTRILTSKVLETGLLSGAGKEAADLNYAQLVKKGFKGGLFGSAFGTAALAAGVNFGQAAFSARSGSDLGLGSGGALNTGIGMIAGTGPIGIGIQAILAALNRFNEIGKKALELFGATAGRYGYGEGFNMSEAQQFINFQSTARKLSAEYAVNLQDVEAAFQGLQEYSGVRTFDQLKKLAEATLQISNATGLATAEVTKLGSAYQKNFGYGAQESVSKAGKQLLGLMNSINSGLTSNLLVTNAEMAALVQNLIEGTQGADVTKTLIPFLDAAFDRVKDLGIQSRVVGDLLRNQMMDLKKSGAGLPGGLPNFMLAAGGLFTNRLGGAEAGIASQVGRGKFAYEQGQEMARITTGPARDFWSSPKLILRNDLVDLAFKLKSGDLASLLASQSDAALGQITQRIFELYQIPGAAEAIGVSLAQITEKFSTIARNNPLQFKLLGGDLDKLTALSEYSKAEATLKTGRVGGTGPMATEEQMKAASETRKAMVAQMTPVDRTNQLLEQIVGFVDQIVVWLGDSAFFGGEEGEELTARRGGLTEEEYKTLGQLTQMPQRDAEQQKQMDLLRGKQNEFRGKSTATVSPVNGSVTTTVVMENPPYSKSIAAAYASGAGRSIGQS